MYAHDLECLSIFLFSCWKWNQCIFTMRRENNISYGKPNIWQYRIVTIIECNIFINTICFSILKQRGIFSAYEFVETLNHFIIWYLMMLIYWSNCLILTFHVEVSTKSEGWFEDMKIMVGSLKFCEVCSRMVYKQ